MRLFIAIDLPQAQKQGIADLMGALKKSGANFKRTNPDDVHITLNFLGEIKENLRSLIDDSLKAAAAAQKPFEIAFGGLGVFDSWKNPKVLWVEITRGAQELAHLAQVLGNSLFEKKILAKKEDRPFKAHLTLGRTRSLKNAAAIKDAAADVPAGLIGGFTALEIHLYRSHLSSAGPRYEILSSFPLIVG